MENVSVNLFALLTNNFYRFDHNLFLQVGKNGGLGPLLFIDNDRSRWKYDLRKNGRVPFHAEDHPLATFCKFPRNLVTRLKLLKAVESEGLSLGKLVYLATSVYDPPSGPIFTLQEAKHLDSTVSYINDIQNGGFRCKFKGTTRLVNVKVPFTSATFEKLNIYR